MSTMYGSVSNVTRREFLAGATGLAAALALPGPLAAATPAHRFQHGAFEVMVVSDGHLVLPTSFITPDAPPAERAALLAAAGQTGDQYNAPANVTLIRTGSDLILVDAGSGANFMPSAGKLAENLEAAGIGRDQITKVVFTHAHPDHIWGATDEFDELRFPNASYFAPAAEWNFWMDDAAFKGLPEWRHGFVTGARRNLTRMKDKLTMIKDGDDIVSGIRVFDTSGHTQGHVGLELAGESGLLVTGDAITHPAISFAHPDWRSPSDHEPERAAATRRSLLDRLATGRMRLIGYHLPFPGLGAAERKDGAYRFTAG